MLAGVCGGLDGLVCYAKDGELDCSLHHETIVDPFGLSVVCSPALMSDGE